MKAFRLIAVLFFMILAQGCYREPRLARPVPDIEVAQPDSPPPSLEKSDLIVYAHIKKRSLPARGGAEEKPYTFLISIDGREFRETVKGVRETVSDTVEERGEGVRYELAKRLRLDPGIYEIALKNEEGISAKVKIELEGARIYSLRFEPVYRSFTRKFGFPRSFRYGISGFTVFRDGKRVWKVH